MTVLSLELYPDQAKADAEMIATVQAVGAAKLDFVSVTCTKNDFSLTLSLCKALSEQGIVPAAHLLCGGCSPQELARCVGEIAQAGITKVVALRGDRPRDNEPCAEVCSSEDLVGMLARHGSFDEICVAGYPDVHPQAQSGAADIAYLRRKADAGATRVITQFTFDIDALGRYSDKLRGAGISLPVSAGLLPIHNFERMAGFAQKCGAHVPDALWRKFEPADAALRRKLAQELLSDMTSTLVAEGFDIHFYSLNTTRMINEALLAAGARKQAAA